MDGALFFYLLVGLIGVALTIPASAAIAALTYGIARLF